MPIDNQMEKSNEESGKSRDYSARKEYAEKARLYCLPQRRERPYSLGPGPELIDGTIAWPKSAESVRQQAARMAAHVRKMRAQSK